LVGHQQELIPSCPAIEGQTVLAQVRFLVQQNEPPVLFLRNSFRNQQAINQWLAID
jgi:hypothetical protein